MSNLVRVKLYSNWRYYHVGEVISVTRDVAHDLVDQNIGEYEKPKQKEIKGAPRDKMLKSAPVTK